VEQAGTANGAYRTSGKAGRPGFSLGTRQGPTITRAPARSWDRWLLAAIYGRLNDAPILLRLWDGTSCGASDAVATVVIHDRGALVALARQPELAFGDYYAAGRIAVDGDLVALLEGLFRAKPAPVPSRDWLRRLVASPNARDRARDSIHHHYDIGNAFYELWLDSELVYTCAYFPAPEASLEEAQIAKMEHVCRKLRLQPGDRVIEAGCGWGALARYMASRYGVRVRAFNISREQIAYARQRAQAQGLSHLVEFIEDDYRAIDDRSDVFVSVGMLEHVGRRYYRSLAEVIDRSLAPDRGRGLLHFIGRNTPHPLHPWIERRIFPGAYPPTLAEVTSRVLGPVGLTVLDVENLRLHYASTLRHWLNRFESAVDSVVEMFDEGFARAWRLYLAGSLASFATGGLQLFQVTFARERDNDVPWTRVQLYKG
jgi:cyclopropane-fatty-acyl-phospholipid synthase